MMHVYFQKNRARGLEMFGVTTEDSVPAFRLQKLAAVLSYPLSARISGGYGAIELSKSLGNDLAALPFTVVVDRHGRVAETQLGPLKQPKLDALLTKLL